MSNWLEKYRNNPEVQEKLRDSAKKASGAQRERLPNLVLPTDMPMFVRTLEDSRIIPKTTYGPREVVDVMILETTDPAQEEGMKSIMWMTQSAFRGQLEKFRDSSLVKGELKSHNLEGETIVKLPGDLDLFILNHGKVKSATGNWYWDYTILPAEEGKSLIKDL